MWSLSQGVSPKEAMITVLQSFKSLVVGGWVGGPESDYSVCPRPFLRPGQDLDKDRDGTGRGVRQK